MDSFLGNTRPFFQGLPATTRGYDGSTLEDQTHAPPTPTPPATPTLPPAHAYHPYQHPAGVTRQRLPLAFLVCCLLAAPSHHTPSHKLPDHTQAASPYSVATFLQPQTTKTSNEARFVAVGISATRYQHQQLPHGPQILYMTHGHHPAHTAANHLM
ncbi:uncharacterized protein LOC121856567 [Homarus americanus]|uniref:uncharacterized protein LOC121856567 n=1 Tax=Homarus americanus TaxID=6706 RepID=UPI001C47322F|nr:uncharacterized protein LOC121856567 [Homarus americanus]